MKQVFGGFEVPICQTCGGWGRETSSWFQGHANARICRCCRGRRRWHCLDSKTVTVDTTWAADAVSAATRHKGFVTRARRFRNPTSAELGQAVVNEGVLGAKLPPAQYVVLQELLLELTRDPLFLGDYENLVRRPPTRETVAFALWWQHNRLPLGGAVHVG